MSMIVERDTCLHKLLDWTSEVNLLVKWLEIEIKILETKQTNIEKARTEAKVSCSFSKNAREEEIKLKNVTEQKVVVVEL